MLSGSSDGSIAPLRFFAIVTGAPADYHEHKKRSLITARQRPAFLIDESKRRWSSKAWITASGNIVLSDAIDCPRFAPMSMMRPVDLGARLLNPLKSSSSTVLVRIWSSVARNASAARALRLIRTSGIFGKRAPHSDADPHDLYPINA